MLSEVRGDYYAAEQYYQNSLTIRELRTLTNKDGVATIMRATEQED
jgi:hypothetical protein